MDHCAEHKSLIYEECLSKSHHSYSIPNSFVILNSLEKLWESWFWWQTYYRVLYYIFQETFVCHQKRPLLLIPATELSKWILNFFYIYMNVHLYIYFYLFTDNLSNAPMQPSRANARSVLNNDFHQNNITTTAEISTTPKTSPKVTGMESTQT